MASPEPIYNSPSDVGHQLAALHLRTGDVHGVLEEGILGLRRASLLHPGNAGGFFMWADSNAAFGRFAVEAGWQRRELKNALTYINPSGEHLLLTSGDSAVGDPTRDPDVRNTKGPVTSASVASNSTMPMFDSREGLPAVLAHTGGSVWMLMYFVDGDMIRSEISMPRQMQGGRILRWGPRIILPVLTVPKPGFDDDSDLGDTADFPIVPR